MKESPRRWTSCSAARFLCAAGISIALSLFACGDVAAVVLKGTLSYQGKRLPSDMPAEDAVILLHGSASAPARGTKAVVVELRAGGFEPAMTVVPMGTRVDFANKDDQYHNVYSRSAANTFDLGLYPPGETRGTSFDKPGVVEVRCLDKPAVHGYVAVSETPYFARVTKSATYRIDGIPAGSYEAEVWHPHAVPLRVPVKVPKNAQVLDFNFDFQERRR